MSRIRIRATGDPPSRPAAISSVSSERRTFPRKALSDSRPSHPSGPPSPTRSETFRHGDFAVELLLPASPEELIDVSDFNVDERLPYWADLWPSARALAASLLELNELPRRAIELGCGVGLPSLALRSRGVGVLATDWYDEALAFAELNAERSGLGPLETMALDWRRIPAIARGRFDLAVAADVLYEERNVPLVAHALDVLLGPSGEALIADPGRSYLAAFLEEAGRKWRVDRLPDRLEPAQLEGTTGAIIQLYRLHRK